MIQHTQSDGSVLYSSDAGTMRLHAVSGVILQTCTGIVGREFAPVGISYGVRSLALYGRARFFTDAWDAKASSADFRDEVAVWMRAQERRVTADVLARSKLGAMAVALMNLMTGAETIRLYASIAPWELAVRQAVPGYRRPHAPKALAS